MKGKIYQSISKNQSKKIALLIDPDKLKNKTIFELINLSENANVDFLFVGGSLVSKPIDELIVEIKKRTKIPLILFPGSLLQLSTKLDAVLLISLISGRNAELLIGNHVVAAHHLKNSKLEILPTGYILIDGGKTTSVEYMSNTRPIPFEKDDIAVATAIAGELLGQKLIYLDAGSGAANAVSEIMIKKVKTNISIPLIVGGGIRTALQAKSACFAGADIIVVGNAFEDNINLIQEIADAVHSIK
ncbi:MAG: geranylgeranylglyceryl/heptaprenylglyceryl phosphate synthase [Bacteroidales bacterium]|nr:geranylgeranylglyceryl/heptaprenylglyceryl phosphate synthase [Bacteroidales bacterium]MBN2755667.1 geranylgeranylglyceryl/heptaprenylglyceryl phosphate synthase [Bacteroidales bacterium]